MVPWGTGGGGAIMIEIIENKTTGKGAINSLRGTGIKRNINKKDINSCLNRL